MWEASDLGSEDLLWASTNFVGGIASQREAVCGAVSSAAVYLGLRHRSPLHDREKASQARNFSREQARNLVMSFAKENGDIICAKLTGIDFYDQIALQKFRESGEWMKKCVSYVRFVIEKLYEMETK